MKDIPLKLLNGVESEQGSLIKSVTLTQNLELMSWLEVRKDVVKILLKKMIEQGDTMRNIVENALPKGKNGPLEIESEKLPPGMQGEQGLVLANKDATNVLIDGREGQLNIHPNQRLPKESGTLNTIPSQAPDGSLEILLPTLEILKSPSMNLIDESANHIFDLMKGLSNNVPDSDVKRYDPDRVNAAVACANSIYKFMRLKLDVIKAEIKFKEVKK